MTPAATLVTSDATAAAAATEDETSSSVDCVSWLHTMVARLSYRCRTTTSWESLNDNTKCYVCDFVLQSHCSTRSPAVKQHRNKTTRELSCCREETVAIGAWELNRSTDSQRNNTVYIQTNVKWCLCARVYKRISQACFSSWKCLRR